MYESKQKLAYAEESFLQKGQVADLPNDLPNE